MPAYVQPQQYAPQNVQQQPPQYSAQDQDYQQAEQKPYQQALNIQQDTHRDQCFNSQWLCFILGWLIFIPLIVGILLPLFSKPRFPTKSYLVGWISNIILLVVEIIAIIVVAVVVSKNNCGTDYC